MSVRFATLFIGLALLAQNAAAQTTATAPADDRPTVIIVQGTPGAPEFADEFTRAADRWVDAAKRANDHVILIGRDPIAPPASATTTPPSTSPSTHPATAPATDNRPLTDRARLDNALDDAIRETTQPLWLVFIGHGTFDGHEAKFNLRDTDISDQELAAKLRPCVRPLAFIDCSSASAPFLNRISGKNRIVITATRSGSEVNFSRFADAISTAIADPKLEADLDKDGQVSLLEAFIAASHKVNEFYKTESRLATEHALLDDNGDALGISADWFDGLRATRAARNGAPLDGPRAKQWSLVPSPAEQALPSSIRAQRDALELQIESLRAKKSTLSEPDYYAQLDTLLLTLAKLYATP